MEFSGERVVPTSKESGPGTALYEEHIKRYLFAKEFIAGKRVLDAACGTGYGTDLLGQHAKEAVGVDLAPEAVTYAREHYQNPALQFLVGDVEHLNFPEGSFDVTVSYETLEHVPHPEAFIQELRRLLKPGGLIIISTPNKPAFKERKLFPYNPFHIKEYTWEEFHEVINKHFTQSEFYGQNKPIVLSPLRRILRAVLQRIVNIPLMLDLAKRLPSALIHGTVSAIQNEDKNIYPIAENPNASVFIAVARKPQ